MSRILILCAAALLLGCGVIPPLACTEIGCAFYGARLETDLAVDLDVLRRSEWTVCINGTCETLTVQVHENSLEDDVPFFECSTAASIRASCFIHTNGHYDADRQFVPNPSSWDVQLELVPVGELVDGDVYRIEVRDPQTGEVLIELDQSVTYARSTPNGPRCGPHCVQATLSL